MIEKPIDEAIRMMLDIKSRGDHDPEQNHVEADKVLCAYIAATDVDRGRELVDIYASIRKWYT